MPFRRKFFPGSRGSGLRASRTFKKKQFSWQYVEAEETSVPVGGAAVDIILYNSSDWVVGTNADNVRNVSIDLRVMFAWTPESTALAFESWYLTAGIFVLDADEATTTVANAFATTRALWWNAEGRNTSEQPAALGGGSERRWMNWSVKKRQRLLKFDEELRFLTSFNATVAGVIADARVSIFGRISWETP